MGIGAILSLVEIASVIAVNASVVIGNAINIVTGLLPR